MEQEDTGTLGGVGVPTYQNHVVIFYFGETPDSSLDSEKKNMFNPGGISF